MFHRTLGAVGCLAVASLLTTVAAERNTKPPPTLGLTMKLAAKKSALPPGGYTECWIEIANRGEKPATLVAPGDGSRSGWRTPTSNGRFSDPTPVRSISSDPTPGRVVPAAATSMP